MLRRRACRGAAVDALVVALAEPGGTVLTSDPNDLRALAAHAVGDRDVVILKVIQTPDMTEYDEIVGRARAAARRAGKKRTNVGAAIKKVRARK